jgi:hypothetical protein
VPEMSVVLGIHTMIVEGTASQCFFIPATFVNTFQDTVIYYTIPETSGFRFGPGPLVESMRIIIIIQVNSILYYLCAESTAPWSIADTAQCRYIYKYVMDRLNIEGTINCTST